MADTPIYIMDELSAKPGKGPALLEAYLRHYVPGAEARGMTLVHKLIEPAFWLDQGSNRLVFLWSLPNAGAVWSKNFQSRENAEVQGFWWRDHETLIASRRRATLCAADRIEELSNV